MKFHCAEIQCPILAVEQIAIPVKHLHRSKILILCIVHHDLPLPAGLHLADERDIIRALHIPLNCERIPEQFIYQMLGELHDQQAALIVLPDLPVEHIPVPAFRDKPCHPAVIIREQPTHAHLAPRISGIGMRLHLLQIHIHKTDRLRQ